MATKMSALIDLVSQAQPTFQTYQALLIIGLQNDFLQPDGRLPVETKTGFLDRISTLVPKFRELNGKVMWVKTVYEANRMTNDASTGEGDSLALASLAEDESSTECIEPEQSRGAKHKQRALDLLKRVGARKKTVPIPREVVEEDEEIFLLKSANRAPACMPDTPGVEFAGIVNSLKASSDSIIKTTNYSAFEGTPLLMTLRARLITELYICGCITNVSILATVIDGARHGIKINVVEDCLGWRKHTRHELALKRMTDLFDAWIVESGEVFTPEGTMNGNGRKNEDAGKELEALVDRLSLNDRPPNGQSQVPIGVPAPDEEPGDEQFADVLMRDAKGRKMERDLRREEEKGETALVKTKVRIRSRAKRKTKKTAEKLKTETAAPEETQSSAEPESTNDKSTHSTQGNVLNASAEDVQNPQKQSARQQLLEVSNLQPSLPSSAKEKGRPLSRARNVEHESTEALNGARTNCTKSTATPSEVEADRTASPSAIPANPSASAMEENLEKMHPPQVSSTSTETSKMGKSSKLQSLANFPALGPDDRIAEGDSRIVHDLFPPDYRHPTDPSRPLKDLIFTELYNEVRWQKMMHQQGEVPRLVCCQGEFGDDGSMPVYRHPSDQSLPLLHFSPKVQLIRKQAEKLVGHPLNHVLIQLYRSGNDFISEHSDKTLDIVKGSSIANASFGAQRTMRLRTKKSSNEREERTTQRVHLPHNSLFILGLASNAKWLHGIMADKRLPAERSEAELDYNGIRISLTFRHIGTFLDAKESVIWGQGATAKSQADAADVINGDEKEAERMIRAFSRENHSSEFNWEEYYSAGFDVLHMHAPPADVPILFASQNEIETKQVQLALWECKIPHTLMEVPILEKGIEKSQHREITFRDNDTHHTEVSLVHPILLYLDRYHPLDRSDSRACTAATFPIIAVACTLLKKYQRWKESVEEAKASDKDAVDTNESDVANVLAVLEERLQMHGGPFIAGKKFSIADCFVWPLVDEVMVRWEGWSRGDYLALTEYHSGTWRKKASVKKVKVAIEDAAKETEECAT